MFCKCSGLAPLSGNVLPGTGTAVHLLLPGRLPLGIVTLKQTKSKNDSPCQERCFGIGLFLILTTRVLSFSTVLSALVNIVFVMT